MHDILVCGAPSGQMSLSSAPHVTTAEFAPAGMGWPKCIGYMLWCMLKPTRHDKAALLVGICRMNSV